MNTGLATQVNAFIKKSEDQQKKMDSFQTDLDKLCETILTLLCVIGSSAEGGMKAEEVKKISIPRDSEGSISARVEYLKRGLTVITAAISDYSSVSSAINDKGSNPSGRKEVKFNQMLQTDEPQIVDSVVRRQHTRMPGEFGESERTSRTRSQSPSSSSGNRRHKKAPTKAQHTMWNLFRS